MSEMKKGSDAGSPATEDARGDDALTHRVRRRRSQREERTRRVVRRRSLSRWWCPDVAGCV